MSYEEYKKKKKNSLGSLQKELEKINTKTKSYDDDRYWKLSCDKSGNGYAIIRFLPAPVSEDIPWVQIFSHSFQGPGGWYIEKSLTTMGQKDPVSEANSILWNSGDEYDKKIARDRKRKLRYTSNIYVVKDPANPDNEGKVFLYEYGKKIHDKIIEKLSPPEVPDGFTPESPVNVFDFEEGANFMLQAAQVSGYRNYDKSKFDSQSEFLGGDDAKLKEVFDGINSLQELVSPGEFKSYDELKAKFEKVVHGTTSTQSAETQELEETYEEYRVPEVKQTVTNTTEDSVESSDSNANDDDDALNYFEKLAQED